MFSSQQMPTVLTNLAKKSSPPLSLHIYCIYSHLCSAPSQHSFFRYRNPLSSTFLFLSEGQQPLFPPLITLSLESASQGTSPAYRSRRLITLIWSHTRQFVISFITAVTIHYSFSLVSTTLGSKLIFSTNPFLHSYSTFPPTRLTPWTPAAVFRFSRACRF